MPTPTTLIYLTGNRFKFHVAQQALRGLDLVLEQNRLAVPEIQSNSVQEIAEFSAQWASQRLDQPFITTDAGFYIDALNGFPGPFIKFINQWFSVDDLLRLMSNRTYRHITIQDCLVYARPGQPSISFVGSYQGKIATEPGQSSGTPIERLYIPQGYETPISEFSPDEQVSYWSNAEVWKAFRSYYQENQLLGTAPVQLH
jgi:XTP/dITP diphosphohydrolase